MFGNDIGTMILIGFLSYKFKKAIMKQAQERQLSIAMNQGGKIKRKNQACPHSQISRKSVIIMY